MPSISSRHSLSSYEHHNCSINCLIERQFYTTLGVAVLVLGIAVLILGVAVHVLSVAVLVLGMAGHVLDIAVLV